MRSLALLPLLALASGALSDGAPLAPLEPSEWTRETAAHLLRRAGFGGTEAEVSALAALGPEGAVDSLLGWEGKPDPGAPRLQIEELERPARSMVAGMTDEQRRMLLQEHIRRDRQQFLRLADWWMRLMIQTAHPLRERLVLFWHGHFTSGYRDVRDSYQMYLQNTLLRRHAAGNFAELLHDISRDPAMLEYLDNKSNRKGRPNENYAREVMELFTMGAGNYAETDIKEAARAFTGWTARGNRFVFNRREHDDGEKLFLGERGSFDGDDILDIILRQKGTADFIAGKIFRAFAHDAPSPEVVSALGRTLRDSGYEMRPMLRQLLLSREFYGPASLGTKIKGPVEFLVGLHRTLGMAPPQAAVLWPVATALGQSLLEPPNVKGWDGGRDWITTSLLLNRYNIAGAIVGMPEDKLRLLGGRGSLRDVAPGGNRPPAAEMRAEGEMERAMPSEEEEAAPGAARLRRRLEESMGVYDVRGEIRRAGLTTPEQIVDHFCRLLLARPPATEMRAALVDYLRRAGEENRDAGAVEILHGLLRLIVSTPEFQLT